MNWDWFDKWGSVVAIVLLALGIMLIIPVVVFLKPAKVCGYFVPLVGNGTKVYMCFYS